MPKRGFLSCTDRHATEPEKASLFRGLCGSDGKLPPVGNTVNVQEATYDNSIGAPFLQAYWKDPDFDPSQRAFYYVRVLEIPTPRWTTYDHKVFGVALPTDVPASIQERAYTSPIWYTPKG